MSLHSLETPDVMCSARVLESCLAVWDRPVTLTPGMLSRRLFPGESGHFLEVGSVPTSNSPRELVNLLCRRAPLEVESVAAPKAKPPPAEPQESNLSYKLSTQAF